MSKAYRRYDTLAAARYTSEELSVNHTEPINILKIFGESNIEIPKLLHYGIIDQNIESLIHSGSLPGMGFEGVVCKARRPKTFSEPIMYKIKNQAWIDKVKANFDKSKWEELL